MDQVREGGNCSAADPKEDLFADLQPKVRGAKTVFFFFEFDN
jgi:hypothetical protein